jgi:hypothetical protein
MSKLHAYVGGLRRPDLDSLTDAMRGLIHRIEAGPVRIADLRGRERLALRGLRCRRFVEPYELKLTRAGRAAFCAEYRRAA